MQPGIRHGLGGCGAAAQCARPRALPARPRLSPAKRHRWAPLRCQGRQASCAGHWLGGPRGEPRPEAASAGTAVNRAQPSPAQRSPRTPSPRRQRRSECALALCLAGRARKPTHCIIGAAALLSSCLSAALVVPPQSAAPQSCKPRRWSRQRRRATRPAARPRSSCPCWSACSSRATGATAACKAASGCSTHQRAQHTQPAASGLQLLLLRAHGKHRTRFSAASGRAAAVHESHAFRTRSRLIPLEQNPESWMGRAQEAGLPVLPVAAQHLERPAADPGHQCGAARGRSSVQDGPRGPLGQHAAAGHSAPAEPRQLGGQHVPGAAHSTTLPACGAGQQHAGRLHGV